MSESSAAKGGLPNTSGEPRVPDIEPRGGGVDVRACIASSLLSIAANPNFNHGASEATTFLAQLIHAGDAVTPGTTTETLISRLKGIFPGIKLGDSAIKDHPDVAAITSGVENALAVAGRNVELHDLDPDEFLPAVLKSLSEKGGERKTQVENLVDFLRFYYSLPQIGIPPRTKALQDIFNGARDSVVELSEEELPRPGTQALNHRGGTSVSEYLDHMSVCKGEPDLSKIMEDLNGPYEAILDVLATKRSVVETRGDKYYDQLISVLCNELNSADVARIYESVDPDLRQEEAGIKERLDYLKDKERPRQEGETPLSLYEEITGLEERLRHIRKQYGATVIAKTKSDVATMETLFKTRMQVSSDFLSGLYALEGAYGRSIKPIISAVLTTFYLRHLQSEKSSRFDPSAPYFMALLRDLFPHAPAGVFAELQSLVSGEMARLRGK